jgi:hypothetical protein
MSNLPSFVIEAKNNFALFSSNCLIIRTKNDGLKPLVLNRAQRFIHAKIQEQLASIGKVRVILLKGRQQGASTYVEARFIWLTTMTCGVRAFILTHEAKSTNSLFNMTSRFYDNLPTLSQDSHTHNFKPTLEKSNAKELIFTHLDSGFEVGTAGNKGVGRGDTLQFFHGSEVSRWPNASEHTQGILQAIPDGDGTEIILESTGNGLGNFFHQQWKEAEAEQSEYIAIFIPWFWQLEYSVYVQSDFARTQYEEELAKLYGLSNEQMAWRRLKIKSLGDGCSNGEKAFKQEYPMCSAEAFQTSGEEGLISADIVQKARRNEVRASGSYVVGVDPSRGGDRFSWTKRAGRKMWGTGSRTFNDYKLGDGVAICVNLLSTVDVEIGKKPDFMFVDAGYGADIVDRLHELGYDNVKAIWFGSTPFDIVRYVNKRAEMWGEMNKWLRDENLSVQITDTDSLHADLLASPYKLDSKDRIQLQPKDYIKKMYGYSPDEGDSAALTFAEQVATIRNVGYNDEMASTEYNILG